VVKQVQKSENQLTPKPETQSLAIEEALNQATEADETNVSPKLGESVASIPGQLYDRLGLTMPRWLFWVLTIVVGTMMSGLLVSGLALWTPLWSDIDRTGDDELGLNAKDEQKTPLPAELWSNLSKYQLTRPMNILVMGIEPVPTAVDGSPESFAGKSDSMLLLRLNPESKTIRVLSIPRDTMIAIPEKGLNKVSEANAQGGPVLAARVVSRTLNNAIIDRFIRIPTSGLRQLVDELGGVEVFVPQDMRYQDNAQRLSINLVNGWQTLNGEQAENFVRYREKGMGDLERVQRQQALLMGLRERLSSPTVLPRLPKLTRILRKYIDTNLKSEEIMALVNFSLNIERDNFQMTMLPGIFSRMSADPDSYWIDLTGQVNLLNNYVGVTIAGMNPIVKALPNLKIAVQNASNKPELTQKVIDSLKQRGFTNVYAIPDWADRARQTQIIAQKANRDAAEELQKSLGLGEIQVSAIGDLQSDLTIRIGKDFK
jgi:polyisoprenyl-teichoic acid--peptidoglycan teichoic acid transferase